MQTGVAHRDNINDECGTVLWPARATGTGGVARLNGSGLVRRALAVQALHPNHIHQSLLQVTLCLNEAPRKSKFL